MATAPIISQETFDRQGEELASIFDLPTDAPAGEGEVAPPASDLAPEGEGVVAPPPSPSEPSSGGQPPVAGDGPTPAAAPAPSQPPAAPAVPAPSPAPAVPPAEDWKARYEALEGQVRLLMEKQTQQPQAQPAAPAAQPGNEPAAPPQAETPAWEAPIDYRALSIPDELAAAIFDEDPVKAKAGLNALVASLGQVVHTRLRQEYQGFTKSQLQGFEGRQTQQQQQHTEAEQARQMQEEFYGEHPALNNPVAKQIVAREAGLLAVEQPNMPWGKEYRDALAARTHNAIRAAAGLTPEPAPAPTPPAPPPPPKPAAFAPTGARSGTPLIPEQTNEAIVEELFNFPE